MKKLIFCVILLSLIISCEKNLLNFESEFVARIAGFDPNCAVCILEFPDDSMEVRKEIGNSRDNYYLAANLTKGNYEIGQKLKVKIRKARAEELSSCIIQNVYESVVATSFEKFSNMALNDTIDLPYRDCRFEENDEFYVCLDSVLNDSRCPNGAYCFWEGNALVRVKFEKLSGDPVFFDLNTYKGFRTDTTINGYTFSLVGLNPKPSMDHQIPQKDYIARIVIKKEE